MKSYLKIFDYEQFVSTVLLILYIIVTLIYQQHLFNEILSSNLVSTVLGFSIVFVHVFSKDSNFSSLNLNRISLLAFLLVLFVLANSFLVRNKIMTGALFNIIICGVIGFKINQFRSKPWLLLIPFWFLTLYILSRIQIDLNPEKIFINSRNYVSFYLIITVLPYYFVCFKKNEIPSIIPAIITVILSFYSLGRSGIVASLLILIAVLVPRLNKEKRGKLILMLIFLVGTFITFSELILSEELISLNKFKDVNSFMKDGGRSSIISEYVNKMDFASFILGMDVQEKLEVVRLTYGHVHSSLINFHSAIGLGSLLFFYSLYLKGTYFFKNNVSLLILMLAIIVRSSTDVGLLFSYFDYVFWMFLFFPSSNKLLKT